MKRIRCPLKNRILLFLLCFAGLTSAHAETGYSIQIGEPGYDLQMQMDFHQNLNRVKQVLRNGAVLARLSPNVKSVVNTPENALKYDSLMVVKSFGIKSELLSKCQEALTKDEWTRACELQVDQKDGGEYMLWKKDKVVCRSKDPSSTHCEFVIQGKAKDLKILGVKLMSGERFSVKAKYQALSNFFKLFYFIEKDSLSTPQALADFEKSKVKVDMDAFQDEALSILKDQTSYSRQFKFEVTP